MFPSPLLSLGVAVANCLIGVGANLGDRSEAIGRACERLREHKGVTSLRVSQYYTTKPIGGPEDQAEFLNAAFYVETSLSPQALLQQLQQIEQVAGRQRAERWEARHLDLDLLLYDDAVIEQEQLVIPHPRMVFRRFVLEPAAEIAGEMTHPTTQRTITDLWQRLDTLASYIAISDAASAERQSLLRDVATQTGAQFLLTPASLNPKSRDPPSPDLASAIEFLDQRIQLVERIGTSQEDRVWLSDFWLGDALLAAPRSMSIKTVADFEDAWREREVDMPEPVLVVVFDATKSVLDALQRARLPALKLNSVDSDWNRQEVAAAIEALK